MMEETLMKLISSVGFPIVISLWFMFRTERVIQANTEALSRLIDEIIKLQVKRGR